ncbi:hypothetical protein [Nonomuraea aurantiaca]|uniref:hypothetical protein n=1 Tax=Nonomuraea aurantiaca TaxID=2878562 RepID=UPI001CD95936|nr:hypothetical protein [Nonomuraea aurantiaca]MCA2230362.1 hypothetical protein [Nonomuraea aurantiaca]
MIGDEGCAVPPVRRDRGGGAAGPGQVLVEVRRRDPARRDDDPRARGTTAGPATSPSGQDSDLACVVVETGWHVRCFAAGDEVLGFITPSGRQRCTSPQVCSSPP